jgi:hypothetical protein
LRGLHHDAYPRRLAPESGLGVPNVALIHPLWSKQNNFVGEAIEVEPAGDGADASAINDDMIETGCEVE